ncbi:rhomboid family intramembrane serine protease [Pontibacter qinzhouensis]|uniref:Rhomboid family intramembrane serine protease n=1 Tax=Pontibacter qinzhouensis TaxID=2603253 RepID=A0A5C8KDF2_9BACT|nr:rhomboid family intramembrane serine protease [Pontibacter qinzhouensis]TXK51897.1 rhomboid family intramembrane serine protease [Pontibacter qinzhouensis]
MKPLQEESDRFAYSFLPGALFVGLLWLIKLMEFLTDAHLVWLGVLPRRFFGLIGVVTSPLIHGGVPHLLSNSFPLVLLTGLIIFLHRRVAWQVLTVCYVGSGLLTWFIGRHSYHIGASGVVYAMVGYLFFLGMFRRDRSALAVSLAILFLYSGFIYGLFPNEERISWEGHLGGILAGLLAAIVFGSGMPEPEPDHEELLPLSPDQKELQQQHLSSTYTSGSELPFYIQYKIANPDHKTSYHHRYYLNSTSGMVEAPTQAPVSTSSG